MEEKYYYLGFSLFSGTGAVRFKKLLSKFSTAKHAWEAQSKELEKILGPSLTGKFIQFRESIKLTEEYNKILAQEISIVIPPDKTYPKLLQQLPNPPFVLYAKGNIEILNFPNTIGIVGTRKVTQYGKEVTEMVTRELVNQHFVTVSGLAFGVDSIVAETTMNSGGKTIAVLGCGVDCCTPSSNRKIYDRILSSGGAIVSTFKPREQASKGSFPARNAIIAGLSLGVVVTEGAADSGALITAEYATKFGRPVFAVPGPITSGLSKGSNTLLQKGAIAVTSGEDIINNLKIEYRELKVDFENRKSKKNLSSITQNQYSTIYAQSSSDAKQILDVLQLGPLHFDEIVRTIGKSTKEIGSLLSLMELQGMVKNDNGEYHLSS